MITFKYKPSFLRELKKLPLSLREEAREKIALFQEDTFHASLKTHKLKERLRERWSFSVNYRYRIVFRYEEKNTIILLAIGDHSIYE